MTKARDCEQLRTLLIERNKYTALFQNILPRERKIRTFTDLTFAVIGIDGRTWYMTQDKGQRRRLVQIGFKPHPPVYKILFHLVQPTTRFTLYPDRLNRPTVGTV